MIQLPALSKPLVSWYLLLAATIVVPLHAAAQDATSGQVPEFEESHCPFDASPQILEQARCGWLTVPERRDTVGGRTLKLAVAVIRSHSPDPAPDPVVFLSGGPGGGSVEHTPGRVLHPFWDRLRQDRDLVFFDQRGTGYSEPAFCREMDIAFAAVVFRGLTERERTAKRVRAAASCREQMQAQGVDLAAYNSAASARDLADLRRALGYEDWNLLGLSYGTRLALTALRDAPEGIRSVILDSALPPDIAHWSVRGERFSRSLRLVFDQCAADPECRAAFPTLEDDFYDVIADLERDPVVIAASDTSRFPDGRLVVDGTLWAQGVFQGLYDRSIIPLVPLIVRESQRRTASAFRALAEELTRETSAVRQGMAYAVDCYEEAPFNAPHRIRADERRHPRLGAWHEMGYLEDLAVCDAWLDARADSTESRSVQSNVPVLIFAGEFDPITPPDYGRQAARTLPNATFVEVPAMGHGVSPFSGCTRGLIHTFLEAPERPLDTSCAAALPGISFVTNVHRNSGVYRFAAALQGGAASLAGAGVLALVLLSAVVGWTSLAVARRLRGRAAAWPAAPMRAAARPLAAVAAALTLVFLVGLAVTVRSTAAENRYVLAFGVPGDSAWLFAIPWAVVPLTLGVVAAAVLAWRRGWWTRVGRIHYSLTAAACIAAVVLFASWGLM